MYASANRGEREVQPETLLGWALPKGPLKGEDLEALAGRLSRTAIEPIRVAPWVAFGQESYRRITLFASDDWEMVLTCWMPGQASVVHNHGGSCGASLVISGQLTETLFAACQAGAEAVQPEYIRVVGPGDVLIESCQTVHRVENRSARQAIGLHFYSPPIAQMKPFAPRPEFGNRP